MTHISDEYAQDKQNETLSKVEDIEDRIKWAIRRHKETRVTNRCLERLLVIEKEIVKLEHKLPTLDSDVELSENMRSLERYLEETAMIKEELEEQSD
jgi:hypothetical protein